jgi:predicted acyl esterase
MHFDLLPISWEFKKGSRIRVSISGVDKDIFEIINPEGYEINLHYGAKYASKLNLPIISKK